MGEVSSCGSAEMLSPGSKPPSKRLFELSKILLEAPSGITHRHHEAFFFDEPEVSFEEMCLGLPPSHCHQSPRTPFLDSFRFADNPLWMPSVRPWIFMSQITVRFWTASAHIGQSARLSGPGNTAKS